MIAVSFACRRCHRGWWRRPMPDRCDKCHGTLVVTGQVTVLELR